MTQNLVTQEIAIVVAVKNQNPNILNEDFLKYSGIVPTEWQLAGEPVQNNQVSQLVFTNGFSIIAQVDRVMFLEAVGDKNIDKIAVGTVAHKYIETLKLAEYQAVGINFRSYVPYENQPEAPNRYICEKILSTTGKWQNHGEEPVRAAINLLYTLKGKQLNLTINEATIQFDEQTAVPVILFGANFNYELDLNNIERVRKITTIIDNWTMDFDQLHELVNSNFQEVPNSFIPDKSFLVPMVKI